MSARLSAYWQKFSQPLTASGIALLVGALFILITGNNPLVAYSAIFRNAFQGVDNIAATLQFATPLLFSGIATALAFRAGIFNIGVEGQLYMGSIAATVVGAYIHGLPAPIHIALSLGIGGLVGGLWAIPPAYMKAKWEINEIVSTIMMNYIALLFTSYLVNYPFMEAGNINAQTYEVAPSAMLLRLLERSRLNIGLLLAVAALALVYWILWRTPWGLEMRTVGLNKKFAEYKGIPVTRRMVQAMILSGVLAGIGGGVEMLGVYHRFMEDWAGTIGVEGISVALLGNTHPVGVFLAALFFGGLKNGGLAMERVTDVSRHLISVLQAIVIFVVAAKALVITWKRKRGAAGEAKV